MRVIHATVFAVLLVAALAVDTRAQLIEGPVGSIGGVFGGHRPVDPNRDSQSLETTFDLSGGYDRNPTIMFGIPGESDRDLTRWVAGTGSASLRYRAGSLNRNVDARGRTYMNYQSTAGDSLVGGEGSIDAVARFGRRHLNQLSVGVESAYEPGWVFGAFAPSSTTSAAPVDTPPPLAPPTGVFEQRWMVMSGNVGYQQHWNLRHVTAFEVEERRLRPVTGGGLDSDWRVGTVSQSWAATPRTTLLATYRIDQNVQRNEDDGAMPSRSVKYHSVDAGFRYEKRTSPTRRFGFGLRGGVTSLLDAPETQAVDSVHPLFVATIELIPSRRFDFSTEYSRGVTVLAGVSAIPVVNDAVEFTVAGTPTPRMRYSVAATASRANFLAPDPARRNRTDVAGVTLDARYALARWAAVFAAYGFYHHRIDDPTLVNSGFPSRYDRHSVRVGMTLWAPLYGTF